ncbi:hypothetical protein FOMPIDRAFT_150496 [Fomitopsis schrenkii]|uniref:Sodium/calcium exchanger membrane region domain-containing protein n=1 Tax=Fomitopsis schrenkii TaxID=2126942 RepID=S8E7W7_FOMSC|nr:hypothetical protein FOMPIDRAFT_150496 [Fomitopsis schrenkii]
MSNLTRNLSSMSAMGSLRAAQPVGTSPGVWRGIKAILTISWLNILLLCIPIAWALDLSLPHTNSNDTLVFIFSFFAIIPLARLLAFATDELSLRVGQTLAGLLNATLVSRIVELIIAIIALVHCELQIVQSSLVGSILSDLLLVLGMCFFAGGIKFSEQGFGQSTTQLNCSLLIVSVIAILLPAAFHQVVGGDIPISEEGPAVLSFSRGVAVILLLIYACYLVFQLFSHKELYEDRYQDEGGDIYRSAHYPKGRTILYKPQWLRDSRRRSHDVTIAVIQNAGPVIQPIDERMGDAYEIARIASGPRTMDDAEPASSSSPSGSDVGSFRRHSNADVEVQQQTVEPEGIEAPQMSMPLTIGLLVIVTALVAVTAEWLVGSINGLTDSGHIKKQWVGLILLPIVSNAAEHATAVSVSVKDKLTLSLSVAIGAGIQISLFVIPFTVVLSWVLGKPLTMLFDPLESIVLFLSVLVVHYTASDGKSYWLEGVILMCLYLIIAVIFWYYPGDNTTQQIMTQSLAC